MKTFNTAGKCIPSLHYMVDISEQVESATELVRDGRYFCIIHGHKYGKTTTVAELKKNLDKEGYSVFSLNFKELSENAFEDLETLLYVLIQNMVSCIKQNSVFNLSKLSTEILQELESSNSKEKRIYGFSCSKGFSKICQHNRSVLIIDGLERAINFLSFVYFLDFLRSMYERRELRPTFHSVILVSECNVNNLQPVAEHKYNSPFGSITYPFNVDMSLKNDKIESMLLEYASDHEIEIDASSITEEIMYFTSGYPYLVSHICQIIYEQELQWDKHGVQQAVALLLDESNEVFDSIQNAIVSNSNNEEFVRNIISNRNLFYTPDIKGFNTSYDLDIIKREYTPFTISNKVFLQYLQRLFARRANISD